jgi:hypothetical protein
MVPKAHPEDGMDKMFADRMNRIDRMKKEGEWKTDVVDNVPS